MPAARIGEMEEEPAARMEEEPNLLLHGSAVEAAGMRGNDGGGTFGQLTTRTPTMDSDDHISLAGMISSPILSLILNFSLFGGVITGDEEP